MLCINFATERDCARSGRRNSFKSQIRGGWTMRNALITGGALAVIFAGSAEARSIPNTGTPQSVQQLIACRSITDSAQRLACYDRQAAVVEKGIATKDLVVIDKARATAAKR